MLNILVNAYAINPHWGSEPGMGWNWVIHLARYCRLHVITEGEWQQEIEQEVAKLPQRENLRFYYLPVPERVRRMCWNQGDWRFYFYYRKWQLRALKLAQDIIARHPIDVIHQLNMIGFREPGYLWKIEDIPYVWGPVGGMGLMPTAYLDSAGWKMQLFCRVKNAINALQYRFQPRVRRAIRRADVLVAAVKGVQEVLERHYHRESILINETGTFGVHSESARDWLSHGRFDALWVGKFDFRKQLGLAIRAVAATQNKAVHLHICGEGSESQTQHYRRLAEQFGVAEQCHWYGRVEHREIAGKMSQCDVLFFSSISDATSTVVMEAIEAGLPILCFNTCGFGDIVKRFAGVTIELTHPEQSVREFAEEINRLDSDRDLLKAISEQELAQRDTLCWDFKARQVVELYHEAVRRRESQRSS